MNRQILKAIGGVSLAILVAVFAQVWVFRARASRKRAIPGRVVGREDNGSGL